MRRVECVAGMLSRLFDRRKKPRLKLGQSPGAFALPEGEISPLFIFLEVANEGDSEVGIRRVCITPKSGPRTTTAALEGERTLPFTLEAGGAARFWVRAKDLAGGFEEAGYSGSPRASLVVEDALGNTHEKSFRLHVDRYLSLKDE